MSIFGRFFFGRHQNDINFDVDFMSTTHNFFFWKFFSFLTHVDKVWTLRKIYIFTMTSTGFDDQRIEPYACNEGLALVYYILSLEDD